MTYYMKGFLKEAGTYAVLVIDPVFKKGRKTQDFLRFGVAASVWEQIEEPLESYIASRKVSPKDISTFISRIVHPSPKIVRRGKFSEPESEFIKDVHTILEYKKCFPIASQHFATRAELVDWGNGEGGFEDVVREGVSELRRRLTKRYSDYRLFMGAGTYMDQKGWAGDSPTYLYLSIGIDIEGADWYLDAGGYNSGQICDMEYFDFQHFVRQQAWLIFSGLEKKTKKYKPVFPWGAQPVEVEVEQSKYSDCFHLTIAFLLR